jgi:hypothetical protein
VNWKGWEKNAFRVYLKELTQYSLEMTDEKHHSIIANFISNTESDS